MLDLEGEVEDYEQYQERIKRVLDSLVRTNLKTPNITITGDLFISPEVNAYAHGHRPNYMISINSGLLRRFQSVSHTLLSCCDAFVHVGSPNSDTLALADSELDITLAGIALSRRSYCPRRKAYADYLTILAVDFVTLHEFGHLLHGHLDFLQEDNSSLRIAEAETAIPVNHLQKALDEQTIEYDADIFAAGMLSKKIMGNDFQNLSALVAQPSGFQDRAYLLHSALQILFDILADSSNANRVPIQLRRHPPPTYRNNYITSAISEFVRNDAGPIIGDTYSRAACYGAIETEIAFRKAVLGENLTRQQSQKSWDEGGTYLMKLNSNWSKIRPRLEPLILGGALAP